MDFVVMLDAKYEDALSKRWKQLVGRVGARHLKIDWDNECASNGAFAEIYPTIDHVREASVKAFNRIDQRLRAVNPDLLTRSGAWPSPWWLCYANHIWLSDSGDSEFSDWPSRTQQDRELTERDASYDNIVRMAQSPVFLNSFDNHGFSAALDNPFAFAPQTWLDNLVMQFTRGTLYMHFALSPEGLRDWQADTLQQSLEWFRCHAPVFGGRHSTMVGGRPGLGEIYGYLHPGNDESAWLVLRNPSPQPQRILPPLANWLGWAPLAIRQVHPFWSIVPLLEPMTLLGHEVRLFRLYRLAQPDASPVAGAPFMVRRKTGGYEYQFPGGRSLTKKIGPTVHPEMQISGLAAESTFDGPVAGGWHKQWYITVPYRFEKGELIVTLRGSQQVLDGLTVKAGTNRDRGAMPDNPLTAERVFRREQRGWCSTMVMPPLGERKRDDYIFGPLPDGGRTSITLEVLGKRAERAQVECWITGYEAPARRKIHGRVGPMDGPLLPMYPLGFSRALCLDSSGFSAGGAIRLSADMRGILPP